MHQDSKSIWTKIHILMLISAIAVVTALIQIGSFFGENFRIVESDKKTSAYSSILRLDTGLHDGVLPITPTWTYRGNLERSGVHRGTLTLNVHEEWRTDNLNVGVHSASKSSPAVDATGIYVGADSGWFYHFKHSGELVWKYHTDTAFRGIHGSALLDEAYVYFGSYNGYFYCLQKNDGQLVWKVRLADAIGTSPMTDGQAIYVGAETNVANGALFKIEPKTGEVIWRSLWFGEQVHSSPTLDIEKKQIYIGSNSGDFFAFQLSDGSLVWKTRLGGAIKGTGALDGDRIFVSSWSPAVFSIDTSDGKVLWQTQLKTVSQSSPTLVPNSDILVLSSHRADSEIYGIKKSTGKIIWREPTESLSSQGSGVAVQTNKGKWVVWAQCRNKNFCAWDPHNGRILKMIPLPESLTSVASVFENSIYLSLDRGPLLKYSAQ